MTFVIAYLAPSVALAAVATILHLLDERRKRRDRAQELVILSLEDAYWSPSYRRHHVR